MDKSIFQNLVTDRLALHPLVITDASFILELLNTPGWLTFIGDRQVSNITDAEGYINKIINNPAAFYWVAKLKENNTSIGVITFLQRDYLKYPDLGFAFLLGYQQQGYAFEAASTVLNYASALQKLGQVDAITSINNISSINLLIKLGFTFDKEMMIDAKTVRVYNWLF